MPGAGGGEVVELTRVIYLDLLLLRFLGEALFDGLLLWTTARLAGRPRNWGRLAVASLVGAGYGLWESLAALGMVPLPPLAARIGLVLLVSWLMLAVAFDLARPRSLLPLLLPFYGAVAAAAGAGFAAGFLLGQGPQPNGAAAVTTAGLTLAVMGWQAPRWLRRERLQRASELLVRVEVGGRWVEVVGLVDTGNQLREPLSGWPVVVLEMEAAAPLFPESLRPLAAQVAEGDLGAAGRLQRSPDWAGRWRMIPFSSLGTRHGLMLGFRPDRVQLGDGRHQVTLPAVVGLSVHLLDAAGRYQALVPPDWGEAQTLPDVPSPEPLERRGSA